jgi:hypothetical protein
MSPRSLFNIILKVIGIVCIKDILVTIPTLFSYIYFSFNTGAQLAGFLFILFSLLIYFSVAYLLLFKSDWIIEKTRIEEGLPEDVSIRIHRSTVLLIAVLIIGWLILLDTIPVLIGQIVGYWRSKNALFNQSVDSRFIIIYSIKILIGLLMVGNARTIVNFIEFKRKGITIPESDSSTDQ